MPLSFQSTPIRLLILLLKISTSAGSSSADLCFVPGGKLGIMALHVFGLESSAMPAATRVSKTYNRQQDADGQQGVELR